MILNGIRTVRETDAQAIADIYGPVVKTTASSFEQEPPTADDFRQRIAKTLQIYPWLAMEKNGRIAGYAYAARYRERHAWQWSASSSVYIHPDYQRQGVGYALYESLFDILRQQGFYNVFAGATLPNPGSVALHEKIGFQPAGLYKSAGYKLGQWHDVVRWQLILQPHAANPAEPVPFSKMREAA